MITSNPFSKKPSSLFNSNDHYFKLLLLKSAFTNTCNNLLMIQVRPQATVLVYWSEVSLSYGIIISLMVPHCCRSAKARSNKPVHHKLKASLESLQDYTMLLKDNMQRLLVILFFELFGMLLPFTLSGGFNIEISAVV